MKYVLAFSILFCFCTTPTIIDADKQSKKIYNLLEQWHRDAANGDLDSYIGLMDSTCNYIGTDATENWSRDEFVEFCKPYFDKKTTWDFKTLHRDIRLTEAGNTAWFDEILDTHMGTCRGSGVFVLNAKNEWKLMQYVLSIAIPNESIEAVTQAKFEADSVFKYKFKLK